jgi:hypothetical protein
MPLSGPLYERITTAPPVPAGLPLVVALTGFTDAGSAVSRVVDHLHTEHDPAPVVTFNPDVLFDYRARRPIITFDGDHLTDYQAPRLDLALVHDTLGQPFVLLSGYEPDFAWEAFVDTVVGLADTAGKESRERVRAALLSSGLEYPLKRVTVNLAPAAMRKAGSGLELAIARSDQWRQVLRRALMFRLAVSLGHPLSTPASMVGVLSAVEQLQPLLDDELPGLAGHAPDASH